MAGVSVGAVAAFFVGVTGRETDLRAGKFGFAGAAAVFATRAIIFSDRPTHGRVGGRCHRGLLGAGSSAGSS
jgi:hypothetical protein